ncbi:MAG TPA: NADH-quinone oxidoreductase subunit D [Candidatus Polarisedimenticolia bacterium]|jgi:NADH-quinone oxidoreductase subunit D|nr:NADH-quinone oxidoreductase subunit D [Candidatus Polarisedimenticolia bacterium]
MLRTEEMEINMGPQHPSTHGVLRLILHLDGETIAGMRPVIGYLHRGVEKLSEHRTYPMIEPLTDRLDYVAAVSENFGWCGAVERLMGVTPPPRAEYLRVVLAELQRIASHLLWLGTHGLDLGAMSVFFYTFRERELILDLFEAFCGARLTTNSMRIGGFLEDAPRDWLARVRHFLKIFPGRMKEYEDLLTKNRIFVARTKGVGLLSAQEAVALGVSGPPLRASGVSYDVRKATPYSAYPEFQFDIPLGQEGDTYDRYLVRMEEMRQSCRIVAQALDRMPDGEVRAKVPKYIKPPQGEVYHAVESPRGEQGFYVVSEGGEMPYRVRFRAPSFANLQALETMCRGRLVADVVAVIGSIDIVLGDCDR